MSRSFVRRLVSLVVLLPMLCASVVPVYAQTNEDTEAQDQQVVNDTLQREIDGLQNEVKKRQDKINDLNGIIQNYKTKVTQQESAATSLQNQIVLLQNRIKEKQLGIERTQTEVELTNLEIQSLDARIRIQNSEILDKQKALAELLRRIRQADEVNPMYVFLTKPSLSEFFSRLDELTRVEQETDEATKRLKEEKKAVELTKQRREGERKTLVDRQQQLESEQDQLERDQAANVSLLAQTEDREDEFQRILSELRQQQQGEADSIHDLQDKLHDRLNQSDEILARGDDVLQWPIIPQKGISAHFHDKSYPFRKLFEHPGIDLPTPVGTPVKAAGGGYVAWTRTGKQYGNYIMVVHTGGIATVYAHLSAFAVKPDTYVERGDIIGYSGGRPGDPGAGLSTGAHLHFEVRQNGIPTNPENFLPELAD